MKQSLSNTLKLDKTVIELLLEQVLKSQADPNHQKAITDFLSLTGAGLIADYANAEHFDFEDWNLTPLTPANRVDEAIDFNWGTTAPFVGIDPNSFSVRWTGQVKAEFSEEYIFYIRTNGGVKLWFNDDLILDNWGNTTLNEFCFSPPILTANQFYNLQIEYANHVENALIQLSWESSSTPKTIVPKSQLKTSDANSSNGLTASYFNKSDLTVTPVQRTDPAIAFNWGASSPALGSSQAFSVCWTGKLLAQYSEQYSFYIRTNSGVRLKVNGTILIDQWDKSVLTEYSSSQPIALIAGQLYNIELEYKNNSTNAIVQLSWSSPSTSKSIVPQCQLYTDDKVYPHFTQSYTLLHKAALIVTTFKMTAKEVDYLWKILNLPARKDDFAGFDFNHLPLKVADFDPASFNQWERLYDFFTLRDSLPAAEVGLTDVFATSTLDEAKKILALATEWDAKEIDSFNLNLDALKNEISLIRLQNLLSLSQSLGVTTTQLLDWSQNEPDQPQAEAIKRALKARYDDDEQWLGAAKSLKDVLREQQRSALVAYLLVHPEQLGLTNLKDTNAIYDHLLIDVEMCACQMTSRIKQAISSVQLFVQRCLMGLEKQTSLGEELAKEWKWMKNYRVWEANRKIFLYPENWIEPDLRDDKSPFFKDLENELLQNELTLETAETAYCNYLEKLDKVKRLEICGMYWQLEFSKQGGFATNILHVFGRTSGGDTPVYYYRKWVDSSVWTPWEKVEVDIQGDHLIPVVYERRLRLFWPIFEDAEYI